MNKNTFKSIGAVLAGMVVNVILSVASDTILEKSGIFTTPEQGFFTTSMLVVAFLYRCVYTVAGGYATAALAPNVPMRHVMILGSIGIVLSIIGTIVGWDLPGQWYPIALVIIALPATWLGGKLRASQVQSNPT